MNISEVSKKFDISSDTLRYYEKIGLLPSVNRTDGGIRDYDAEDIRWVGFIKCMRSAGLPIKDLIEYIELFQEGDATHARRKEILINQRGKIKEDIKVLHGTLKMLDYKIEVYDEVLSKVKKPKK